MQDTIWYIAKPGEERRFCVPTPPSPEWAAAVRKQGYYIFRVTIQLPPIFDPSIDELGGEAEVVEGPVEDWELGTEQEKADATSNTTEG